MSLEKVINAIHVARTDGVLTDSEFFDIMAAKGKNLATDEYVQIKFLLTDIAQGRLRFENRERQRSLELYVANVDNHVIMTEEYTTRYYVGCAAVAGGVLGAYFGTGLPGLVTGLGMGGLTGFIAAQLYNLGD